MSGSEWRRGPMGLDAGRWATRGACRTVLLIVHTITSGQRLLEAARLLEDDLRVQVVFTQGPDRFGAGVREFLSRLGASTVSWAEATRTRFDLAIAAGYGGVHEVHAPLILMPHGVGFNKVLPRRTGRAAGGRNVYGIDRQRLVHDGALVPSTIALAHRDDRAALARSCPEAVPAAAVVGDPSHDTLVASRDRRSAYQVALGAGNGRRLVVVTSTWGPGSLLDRRPDLWSRLTEDLPEDEFRIVTLLHPNVWAEHGTWQIRAWLATSLRRGLRLVPPEADWRAVLAAADWVVGDHGSASVYGVLSRVPVLLGSFRRTDVNPDSPAARLGEDAPRLTARGSLRRQLVQAAEGFRPEQLRRVAERITSEPGRSARNTRRVMYRLLRLPQPDTVPVAPPAEPPFLLK
ncbi:hypothetical protein [Actinomadura algeriensis]|uniref:CDP-glycerol:poly(Glycerophosphate) glycerophosphotransferase n=1 Tax=Actinomadura algeriensis TaxID=1679523 RepID=A0ABR9JZW1_9ACTN|nr:hypothetical protein [Actinomadura algeriensis]MBE1535876.1 hypothetical protein [Actinomadura algeriensis]